MAKKTKEEKKLAKAERKQNKALKREKFNQVLAATKSANIQFDPDSDTAAQPKFVDGFNSIWKILQPALEYAELIRITGPKADAIIRNVLDLGARVSTGNASAQEQSLFIQKYDAVWAIASQALEIIKTFTDDNADEVIDKVIDIGDWMSSQKE